MVGAEEVKATQKAKQQAFQDAAERIKAEEKEVIDRKAGMLEQRIGTRWILVAGVITVFVGVGYFLKYAYEHFSLSPLARVIIVAICGLVALAAGEITRRRGYGIVAKGVTALGFAILYTAIFSAYQFYGLIGSVSAFVLSILVTFVAMLYAVGLNEILIAALSLIGGFLTPVIVSTGENLPVPLFGYVLILGAGAMLCAYYRRWRAVNLIAFIGTFALYTGWFEQFYRPAMGATETVPEQMSIAMGWLGGFFVIYLVLPLFYGLVKRVESYKEDVLLVLANAAVTFYYLWTILFTSHRAGLAFCAIGLSVVHLAMMATVFKRCKEDVNLRIVLLALWLFFITVAVPLYLKMHALTMAWAAEGVILMVIGLRYRSRWTQGGGVVPLLLSLGNLLANLPMHTGAFNLVFNPVFGTWCFVAAAVCVCHLIYRRTSELPEQVREMTVQFFYAAMGLLLFAAATMEWYWHCHYNLMVGTGIHYISRGQLIIFAAIMLLFALKPLCPRGVLCETLSLILVAAGSIFTVVALMHLHNEGFVIFANPDFVIVLAFIAAILVCHIKYRQITAADPDRNELTSQIIYGVLGLLLLLAIAAEWYWHCKYNLFVVGAAPPVLKGQVIIFAAIMLLFVIRPICPRGIVSMIFAAILAGVGAMFTIAIFPEFYDDSFVIFANTSFGIALSFVAALFAAAWLLVKTNENQQDSRKFAIAFSLAAIFVLWILLTEEIYMYWYCRDRFALPLSNWRFLAHMYISIMWAVYAAVLMVIGFWQRIRTLRYLAIALFALLLVKIFVLDTRAIENVYRIAAFLATGVTLVAVSYIYQFLRKKGFFDLLLVDKSAGQQ